VNVVIFVPRRRDGGWRDQLWEFCVKRWIENFPEWPIIEGHHDEGPFNRSAAINEAARIADEFVTMNGPWDVAFIIDSDTISDPDFVRQAVEIAHETGILTVAHDRRHMLTEFGTKRIMEGYAGSWKRYVKRTYRDSVSCAVAVSRKTWDLVGGFDERFVGWGYEDTGFHIACETVTDHSIQTLHSECWHLWHAPQPEAYDGSPTLARNKALKLKYEAVRWQPDRLLALIHGQPDPASPTYAGIPKILHRTVPEHTSDDVERWWTRFADLHPDWDLRTYREPIDPADWPLTGDLFGRCKSGAQKAGLIRLEALVRWGGVYVDSDVEPFRPLDPLLHLPAFAAWEDEKVVPDAVLGSIPGHPAFREMLDKARWSVEHGEDEWKSGPGVSTAVLPKRDDVLVLPPGAFYPAHYLEKAKLGTNGERPWVFLEHKWYHSWGSPAQLESNRRRQRVPEPTSLVPVPVTDAKVALCMPWRPSTDRTRIAAHDWCVKYWAERGLAVYESTGASRSEMCNTAAAMALTDGWADVIAFVDADTWVPIAQLISAVQVARETDHIVHAFTEYYNVGQAVTQRGLRSRAPVVSQIIRGLQPKRTHVSGVTVLSVDLLEKIGGYDQRFVGWGFEDQALNLAAVTIGDGVHRINGPAVHWFHRPDPTKHRPIGPSDDGVRLIARYCQAAGWTPSGGYVARLAARRVFEPVEGGTPDRDAMIALLSEDGGPLAHRVVI